jgi:Ser/Thr protein kinase RdoA (MazF antagonist)
MQVFPTQYSTLSSYALKGHLQREYGFEILNCKYLLRGVNDHYLIETKDQKFIFRVYRNTHRSLEEVRSELFLLNSLNSKGIGVSYPISCLSGEQIVEFNAAEGTRYGTLFSYAKGESFNLLSDQQLSIFGRELAHIHNISASIILPFERKPYNINTTILEPIEAIAPILGDFPEYESWINETKNRLVTKLNSFDFSKFSYGYCHYDLLPKNFHFDENDKITFFDFDFLGKGHLVNDLMTFWLHLSLHLHFNKISQEEADRSFGVVVASYREIRELSEEELSAIPYLSFGFWIFFMRYHQEHFDDFSNPFFNKRFIGERLSLIQTFTNTYCNFEVS